MDDILLRLFCCRSPFVSTSFDHCPAALLLSNQLNPWSILRIILQAMASSADLERGSTHCNRETTSEIWCAVLRIVNLQS